MDNPSQLLKMLQDYSIELQEAKNGDPGASRYLLNRVIELLSTGEPIPSPLANWLADKLKAVCAGEVKAQAIFGLAKKRGGQPRYSTEYQELIALAVHALGGTVQKGVTKSGDLYPVSEVSERFGISENKVCEFYKRHIDRILDGERVVAELQAEARSK